MLVGGRKVTKSRRLTTLGALCRSIAASNSGVQLLPTVRGGFVAWPWEGRRVMVGGEWSGQGRHASSGRQQQQDRLYSGTMVDTGREGKEIDVLFYFYFLGD